MNSKFSTFQKIYAAFIILVVAVPIGISLSPWAQEELTWAFKTPEERERSLSNTPYVVDSVETSDGKMTDIEFDAAYNADAWFREFKSNKVAFDKKYDEKFIDIKGTISEISNSHGCAAIELKIEESPFESIRSSNCPQNKDQWSDEVAQVAVGDVVHIRGIYSGSISSSNLLYLYKSHIMKD